MKRIITLAFLFATFTSSTSCANNNLYKVNEEEFYAALNFTTNDGYYQQEGEEKAHTVYEVAPNIFHQISTNPESNINEEVYIQYTGVDPTNPTSIHGIRREGEGWVDLDEEIAKDTLRAPGKMEFIKELEESEIGYSNFKFENNAYTLSRISFKFKNKRLISVTGRTDKDFYINYTYKKQEVKWPILPTRNTQN